MRHIVFHAFAVTIGAIMAMQGLEIAATEAALALKECTRCIPGSRSAAILPHSATKMKKKSKN